MKTMRRFNLLILLGLFLIIISPALADYNYLTQTGNDEKHTFYILGNADDDYSNNYTLPINDGSFITPIVNDFNGDGDTEIVIQNTNNVISLLSGVNPLIELSNAELGTQKIQPVSCDIDGDGSREFVTIAQNSTGDYNLISLGVGSTGLFTLDNIIEVDATNVWGTMICDNFFSSEGNSAYYVFWLDTNKNLLTAKPSGTGWTVTTNVIDDIVTEESTTPYTFGGSHELVLLDDFGGDGYKYLFAAAGDHIYAYRSDGTEYSEDLSAEMVILDYAMPVSAQSNFIQLYSMERISGREDLVAVWTGNSTVATFTGGGVFFVIKKSLFGLSVDHYSTVIDYNFGNHNNQEGNTVGLSIGDFTNDGYDDLVFIADFYDFNAPGDTEHVVIGYDGIDFSRNFSYDLASTRGGRDPANAPFMPQRSWLTDIDGDSSKEFLYRRRPDGGAKDNHELIVYYDFDDDTEKTFTSLRNDFGVSNIGQGASGLFPVDVNDDGLLDLIVHEPLLTAVYSSISTTTTATTTLYPFSVSLNNTEGLISNTKITAGFFEEDAGEPSYNYAMVCDLFSENIYGETFNTNYNFSQNDVTMTREVDGVYYTNLSENFLVFDGLKLPVTQNATSYFLGKDTGLSYRDYLSVDIDFTMNDTNTSFDFYLLDSTNTLASYWRFNRSGSTTTIYKVVGSTEVYAGEYVTGARATFSFNYRPARDTFTGFTYFEVDILSGNTTINSTTTAQYYGDEVGDWFVYFDGNGALTLHSIGLRQTADAEPGFNNFQNGYRTTVAGVTLYVPPLAGTVAGQGFTIIPDENEVFYAQCEYNAAGTYTQRHYIAAPNTVDYTNYKEISVFVDEAVSTTVQDDDTLADTSTAAAVDDFIENLLGYESTTALKFFLFLLIAGAVVVGLFRVHAALGLVSIPALLIAGSYFGLVPTWVIIILVVMAGGIMGLFYKKLFGGD